MKALMGLFWFALRRECSTTRAASYLLIFFSFFAAETSFIIWLVCWMARSVCT